MEITDINSPKEFFNSDITKIEQNFYHNSDSDFMNKGFSEALRIFQQAAKRVPAYKHFLSVHNISPHLINSPEDFKKIPLTDKKKYLDKYPLEELVWDGDLTKTRIINTSSGTTGLPYYWPGGYQEFLRDTLLEELIYKNAYNADKKQTLVIICFGMGTWIAGAHTLFSAQLLGGKGYKITTITPGFNKEETIRILTKLAPRFEQTVIAGIPTFVKDLLEEWRKDIDYIPLKQVKFLFAAEGYSEQWRDYILGLVDKSDPYNDAINLLGSADAALMGFETPVSIMVKRMASQNKNLCKDLFHEERVPSVTSFLPSIKYYEETGGELIMTTNRGIPLIRYNMHDLGGILSFHELTKIFARHGYNFQQEIAKRNIHHNDFHIPIVYVFGRGKFTATIYAAYIYPENLREVLSDKRIRIFTTGRFTLETKYRKNLDHYLNVNVELTKETKKSAKLSKLIAKVFIERVRKLNSEYNRIYNEYGLKAKPKITLYRYADPRLFPAGTIKKNG